MIPAVPPPSYCSSHGSKCSSSPVSTPFLSLVCYIIVFTCFVLVPDQVVWVSPAVSVFRYGSVLSGGSIRGAGYKESWVPKAQFYPRYYVTIYLNLSTMLPDDHYSQSPMFFRNLCFRSPIFPVVSIPNIIDFLRVYILHWFFCMTLWVLRSQSHLFTKSYCSCVLNSQTLISWGSFVSGAICFHIPNIIYTNKPILLGVQIPRLPDIVSSGFFFPCCHFSTFQAPQCHVYQQPHFPRVPYLQYLQGPMSPGILLNLYGLTLTLPWILFS